MKRLYRSKKYRVFAGVAGGLAEYFNVDPVLVRVLFVLITLMGGAGGLIYLILWMVTPQVPNELAEMDTNFEAQPETPLSPEEAEEKKKRNERLRMAGGVLLIVCGCLFFAQNIIPSFITYFWPTLLIVGGVLLLYGSRK